MTICWMERCESTQDALRRQQSSTIALATFHQTQGRGRRGRTWVSPPRSSLALSWRAPTDSLEIEDLPLVSLAVGVALYQWIEGFVSIESTSIEGLHLKWPNDLLFDGRKLAGILCEAAIIPPSTREVIVGVGVNLRRHELIPPQSATLDEICSVDLITESDLREAPRGVERLLSLLHESLIQLTIDRKVLLNQWRESSLPIGTSLSTAGQHGLYRGINHRGALQLDIEGRVLTVESGEVALVGELSEK